MVVGDDLAVLGHDESGGRAEFGAAGPHAIDADDGGDAALKNLRRRERFGFLLVVRANGGAGKRRKHKRTGEESIPVSHMAQIYHGRSPPRLQLARDYRRLKVI